MWPVRRKMTMTANLPRPYAFAVSPVIGPLPGIYSPPSPSQAAAPGLLWRATVRAGSWAIRRLSRQGLACPAGKSTAPHGGLSAGR